MSGECIIYARCSTDKQAKDGQSIPMQITECSKRARERGWKIKGIFLDEGLSGASLEKRTGIEDALNALSKGDVLLVYSTSRLSRNDYDRSVIDNRVKKAGAMISSIKENIEDKETGEMIDDFSKMMNKHELKTIKGRVISGMRKKKEETGTCNFKANYGYRYDKSKKDDKGKYIIIPVLYEQQVIQEIKKMRNTPCYDATVKSKGKPTPYRAIAEYLNNKYHTRNKIAATGEYKKWHCSTVRNIYEREKDIDTDTIVNSLSKDIETEDTKEIIRDCIYLITKNTIRYIGSASHPIEIFNKEKIKRFQIHIFPCDANGVKYTLFTTWLHTQRYIDAEVDESMILPHVDIDNVLSMIKEIAEIDPIITTIGDIPTQFPEA